VRSFLMVADALRTSGSPLAATVPRAPYRWDEARRALLRAELDAWFARAYGLTRKQLRCILDPADLTPRELGTSSTRGRKCATRWMCPVTPRAWPPAISPAKPSVC
jgi:hypothetical protein